MNTVESEESPVAKLDHIGAVVNDLDKTVEHYQNLGIGPFVYGTSMPSLGRKVLGKPVAGDAINNRLACIKIGSVILEFIQPLKGDSSISVSKKSLEVKGEIINHLCFEVGNLHSAISNIEKRGFRIIYENSYKGGGGAAYFDTNDIDGILLEVIEFPK